jgi:hypothetical protein
MVYWGTVNSGATEYTTDCVIYATVKDLLSILR